MTTLSKSPWWIKHLELHPFTKTEKCSVVTHNVTSLIQCCENPIFLSSASKNFHETLSYDLFMSMQHKILFLFSLSIKLNQYMSNPHIIHYWSARYKCILLMCYQKAKVRPHSIHQHLCNNFINDITQTIRWKSNIKVGASTLGIKIILAQFHG